MCGLAGCFETGAMRVSPHVLNKMGAAIESRGPDDFGLWQDNIPGISLVHRRLSILDLSKAGHQPMNSHSGRYVVAFNGEIYNHISLRKKLNGVNWRGHSDTETLLACIEAWGVLKTVKELEGMFAFSIWDRKYNKLTLGRDRMGEKPLYYGWQNDTLLFGSDLNSLKEHPAFQATINQNALDLFIKYSYIPTPYSIYSNIFKLEQGCILVFSAGNKDGVKTKYWSINDTLLNGMNNRFSGTPKEAVDELEVLLKRSIKNQMIADVPIGAFLSGGIDSSTIVALMQNHSNKAIKTFTIGFNEDHYNEAKHAKSIARYLGTDHTELYVTQKDALSVIPLLPKLYSEPFADSSQIPTYLVSKLAKEKVSITLSGDAGDELFCGYNRYQITDRYWERFSNIPSWYRGIISKIIQSISIEKLDYFGRMIPGVNDFSQIGEKLHKAATVLTSDSIDELYERLTMKTYKNRSVVKVQDEMAQGILTPTPPKGLGNVEKMMAMDLLTYLPDDILVKLDRASMGVSLESRVPLLNHKIIEFSSTLPQSIKLRNGITKWPLKQILYKYVPSELVERPKTGFGIPIGDWLRNDLRGWAEDYLSQESLSNSGHFHVSDIREMWREHLLGNNQYQQQLWNIIMFQSWKEAQNI